MEISVDRSLFFHDQSAIILIAGLLTKRVITRITRNETNAGYDNGLAIRTRHCLPRRLLELALFRGGTRSFVDFLKRARLARVTSPLRND